MNKIALSAADDKRIVMENKINTKAFRYKNNYKVE